MKSTVIWMLWVSSVAHVTARIYETADAIIVEAEDYDRTRSKRSETGRQAVYPSAFPFQYPFVFPFGQFQVPALTPQVSTSVVPSGTTLLTQGSCWTHDGKLGTCRSARECDPQAKLQPLSHLHAWVIGIRSTCAYFAENGQQTFGVCCQSGDSAPNPPTTTTTTTTTTPKTNPVTAAGGLQVVVIGNQTFLVYPSAQPVVAETQPPVTTSQSTTSPTTTTATPTTTAAIPTTTAATPTTTATTTTTTTATSTTTAATTTTTSATTTRGPETTTATTQNQSCGQGPYRALTLDEQNRIVGGTDAVRGAWPFVVGLLNNGRQFCGGSLIDDSHILTAAHCVAHMSSWDVARLNVAVQMHVLKPLDPQAIRIKVRRLTRHKGFSATTLHNDIAILTLANPVTFNGTVSPICLPDPDETSTFAEKEASVVGWGALREGGRQPSVLQQVTVKVQTNDQCKKNYGNDAPGGIIDSMICASYPGRDSCSGDSGGPMVIQSSPGAKWVQAGIVSWGIGCGQPPYPGVYTRITSYLNWIKTNLN